MSDDQKDRFGDTLRKKEKAHEEEYFARRERELIEKLRGQRADAAEEPAPALEATSGTAADGRRGGILAWLARLFAGRDSQG